MRCQLNTMLSLVTAGLSLTVGLSPSRIGTPHMMAQVDEFAISKDIKNVQVFDGDYEKEIIDEVTAVGMAAIAEKGSFSIAIPGGSVVAAFAAMDKEALDYSKVHVFLCNEKIPSFPCIEGALDAAGKLGIPTENVHGFGEGSPADLAESYGKLLATHPSIDNDGPVPSVDMMLLGTGPDGHCGCLFPDTPEIKATGLGKIVLAGNDDRADGDFLAVSMDVMCATKVVLVSAAGAGRAEMVAKALSGDFGMYDCPAGMVDAVEQTLWFTTQDALTDFDAMEMESEEEVSE